MKRVPVIATVVVVAAMAVMVKLGLWQLARADEKAALLARYAASVAEQGAVAYPDASQAATEAVLYRRSSIDCAFTSGDWRSVAGRNAQGQTGYVHIIICGIDKGAPQDDQTAYVQAGWTPGPSPPEWSGGAVSGRIAPQTEGFAKLVADPPLAGLAANARPNPADVPNNHLAYAVQWFLFAGAAGVIYALALRRRWREPLPS
ncbi:MAG: SURF1 family protein [Sphingopyxis sp.]